MSWIIGVVFPAVLTGTDKEDVTGVISFCCVKCFDSFAFMQLKEAH